MNSLLTYESLHNHTTASDGTQSYLEVLATAEANGIGVVAFTDHDTLPSAADLKRLREYDGPVKWLLGCEISSGMPKELGGGPTSSLHVLGLFTDPTDKPLLEYCAQAQAARTERMQRMVTNLRGLGLKITVADCMKAAGGDSVGRPHIVRALASYPENAVIIEQLRARMQAVAVASASVAMDYAHMLERPASDYPYRLFLSDDAFVPGVYVESLYHVDMDTAVALIRGAGGVAVVAHWYTAMKKVDAGMLEAMIQDKRIDGVEIMGNPLNQAARRVEPQLVELAARTGCLSTYGVDGHREQDLENFVSDRAVATKSEGRTRRLIERAKPDLSFSNLA